MIKCGICGLEVSSLRGITVHLRNQHPLVSLEDYYHTYINTNDLCHCGKRKKLNTLPTGTIKTCGDMKCNVKQKEYTCLEKYGVVNPSQSPEIIKNRKETCLKKYGVEHYLQTKEAKEKTKITNMEKYGVENVFQSTKIQDKIKETLMSRYGVEHASQNLETKQKTKDTNLERYGKTSALALPEVRVLRNKALVTENFYRQMESKKVFETLSPLFTMEDYKGQSFFYPWKCIKCGTEFEDYFHNKHPLCPTCFPMMAMGVSQNEKRLIYFLEKYTTVLSSQRIIPTSKRNLEIDILLPEYKLGIEYDGMMWHSENFGDKDKNYHLFKTEECEKLGIYLLHFFDKEWLENEDIIKSMILSKIGKNNNILYARKCEIRKVNSKDKSIFLNDCHIQGDCLSSYNIGLYYNNELVSLMTFGKSRFDKKVNYELLRFCNKLNTSVVGGFAKLLKHFEKEHTGILISYADRRFSKGDIYYNNGFTLSHVSKPSYIYFDKKLNFYNRMQFQKHKLKDKLEKFNVGMTEWENMKENGYDRLWDCGNLVFIKQIN